MKKLINNLSAHEKKLLLLLAALLVVGLSYFVVFQKNVASAKVKEEQNVTDAARVAELEDMVARKDEVEAQTEEYNKLVDEIIAKYPTDVTPEKAIVISQEMEEESKTHISSISFLMDNLMGDISSTTTVDEEGNEVTVNNGESHVGFYAALSMNYEATYENFKSMIKYLNSLDDRSTIPAVSISYDTESGNLTGAVTVNMYYLTGTDNEYVEPNPGIRSGVGDIFSSNAPKKVVENDGE